MMESAELAALRDFFEDNPEGAVLEIADDSDTEALLDLLLRELPTPRHWEYILLLADSLFTRNTHWFKRVALCARERGSQELEALAEGIVKAALADEEGEMVLLKINKALVDGVFNDAIATLSDDAIRELSDAAENELVQAILAARKTDA